MIIEEIDESLFISRFEDFKRVETPENPNGNFSYKGLRALFNYLDETGDEENSMKLDVIALCCEFSEYADLDEYLKDYYTKEEINEKWEKVINDLDKHGEEIDEETTEEFKRVLEDEINDNTSLIKLGDDLDEGFIIRNY